MITSPLSFSRRISLKDSKIQRRTLKGWCEVVITEKRTKSWSRTWTQTLGNQKIYKQRQRLTKRHRNWSVNSDMSLKSSLSHAPPISSRRWKSPRVFVGMVGERGSWGRSVHIGDCHGASLLPVREAWVKYTYGAITAVVINSAKNLISASRTIGGSCGGKICEKWTTFGCALRWRYTLRLRNLLLLYSRTNNWRSTYNFYITTVPSGCQEGPFIPQLRFSDESHGGLKVAHFLCVPDCQTTPPTFRVFSLCPS